MDNAIATIQTALRYLAGNDADRARERNGVGFNAFDGIIGHDLAGQETLSWKQAELALGILRRYHKQLSGAGIVLPDKLEAPKSNGHLTIEKIGSSVGIRFSGAPSAELREKIKAIRGWKWNPELEGKPWTVPARSLYDLQKVFPSAAITEEAVGLYNSPVVETVVEVAPKETVPSNVFLRDGKICVTFPYNQDKIAKVKSIGAYYNGSDKSWSVPVESGKKLLEIFSDAVVSDDVKQALSELEKVLEVAQEDGTGIDIPGLKREPYPYQKVGIKFLDASRGGVVLADSPGVGKTLQAVGFLHLHPEQRPAVIVVPASLKINWQREIDAWIGTDETIVILEGKSTDADLVYALSKATIIIVNYDILGAWVEEIKKLNPTVLIVDEAHYLKNQKTNRWKATNELRKAVKRVILLTGTPVLNRPIELFPLLNLIDEKRWNNFFAFAKRYCDAHQKEVPVPRAQRERFGRTRMVWDFNGASNLDELFKITRSFVLRRTKKDVLKELPPKQRVTIALPISKAARKQYVQVLQETTDDVRRGLANGETHKALTQIETLKQECVKAKMEAALEWIENFLENGEKLVVFATHHTTVDAIYDRFKDVAVVLTGDSSQKQRQHAVDAFQTDDNVRLFIGNIQAAGVGITLTAASSVAFVEFGWTPGEMEQAEDRIHRIGQDAESVTIWYLIADETIDEKIIGMLEEKRKVVESVIDGVVSENRFENIAQNFMADLVRGKYAQK